MPTYLFGIVESTLEGPLGITGLDGQSPVHLLCRQGIGAVVSEYRGEPLGTLPQQELLRKLLAHQQVVERAMLHHAVLPVRFGTVLDGPAEATAVLAQGFQSLQEALRVMHDKVEMDVAATWELEPVLREVAQEEAIVRARAALAGQGPPTLEQRVQMGQMVKAALDRRRAQYRQRAVAHLAPLAVDMAQNALVSDSLVMNTAFLVPRARQQAFEEAIRQLDQRFMGHIAFRIIGPLPPYSFSTVEVGRLTAQQIESARRLLGLEGQAVEAGVRKAYRRLAAQAQQAPAEGDGGARERLAQLRQASEMLLRCCRAGVPIQQDLSRLVGTGPDRQGLFFVTVKRSESQDIESSRFGAAEVAGVP
ncbi:MAG: GvpL/GvpF family gas vesicle protein [Chloroflexi bacterium]|nr:GvpL/GvpF family gas vesicle protein [Chloroflexota bacterium]